MILLLDSDSRFILLLLSDVWEKRSQSASLAVTAARKLLNDSFSKARTDEQKQTILDGYRKCIDKITGDLQQDTAVFDKCFNLLEHGSNLGSEKK